MIIEKIDKDLKTAMLAGDKEAVSTLRGIKSAVQYSQVGKEEAPDDKQVIAVLRKESKKRQEAADLYKKGGNAANQEKELAEKKIIENYLPQQMGEEKINEIIDEVIQETGEINVKNMGQIIGKTKAKSGGAADGSVIASLVKDRLKD
jgi:uncharacterized protein